MRRASDAFGRVEKRTWTDCGITKRRRFLFIERIDRFALFIRNMDSSPQASYTLGIFSWKMPEVKYSMWNGKVKHQILSMTECTIIEPLIMANQSHWKEHIAHLKDQRLRKCLLYGELLHGKLSGRNGTIDSQIQETVWKCNICDRIFLFQHMKYHGWCVQDVLYLRQNDTACIIHREGRKSTCC